MSISIAKCNSNQTKQNLIMILMVNFLRIQFSWIGNIYHLANRFYFVD